VEVKKKFSIAARIATASIAVGGLVCVNLPAAQSPTPACMKLVITLPNGESVETRSLPVKEAREELVFERTLYITNAVKAPCP
jgi:hypothetical protein